MIRNIFYLVCVLILLQEFAGLRVFSMIRDRLNTTPAGQQLQQYWEEGGSKPTSPKGSEKPKEDSSDEDAPESPEPAGAPDSPEAPKG